MPSITPYCSSSIQQQESLSQEILQQQALQQHALQAETYEQKNIEALNSDSTTTEIEQAAQTEQAHREIHKEIPVKVVEDFADFPLHELPYPSLPFITPHLGYDYLIKLRDLSRDFKTAVDISLKENFSHHAEDLIDALKTAGVKTSFLPQRSALITLLRGHLSVETYAQWAQTAMHLEDAQTNAELVGTEFVLTPPEEVTQLLFLLLLQEPMSAIGRLLHEGKLTEAHLQSWIETANNDPVISNPFLKKIRCLLAPFPKPKLEAIRQNIFKALNEGHINATLLDRWLKDSTYSLEVIGDFAKQVHHTMTPEQISAWEDRIVCENKLLLALRLDSVWKNIEALQSNNESPLCASHNQKACKTKEALRKKLIAIHPFPYGLTFNILDAFIHQQLDFLLKHDEIFFNAFLKNTEQKLNSEQSTFLQHKKSGNRQDKISAMAMMILLKNGFVFDDAKNIIFCEAHQKAIQEEPLRYLRYMNALALPGLTAKILASWNLTHKVTHMLVAALEDLQHDNLLRAAVMRGDIYIASLVEICHKISIKLYDKSSKSNKTDKAKNENKFNQDQQDQFNRDTVLSKFLCPVDLMLLNTQKIANAITILRKLDVTLGPPLIKEILNRQDHTKINRYMTGLAKYTDHAKTLPALDALYKEMGDKKFLSWINIYPILTGLYKHSYSSLPIATLKAFEAGIDVNHLTQSAYAQHANYDTSKAVMCQLFGTGVQEYGQAITTAIDRKLISIEDLTQYFLAPTGWMCDTKNTENFCIDALPKILSGKLHFKKYIEDLKQCVRTFREQKENVAKEHQEKTLIHWYCQNKSIAALQKMMSHPQDFYFIATSPELLFFIEQGGLPLEKLIDWLYTDKNPIAPETIDDFSKALVHVQSNALELSTLEQWMRDENLQKGTHRFSLLSDFSFDPGFAQIFLEAEDTQALKLDINEQWDAKARYANRFQTLQAKFNAQKLDRFMSAYKELNRLCAKDPDTFLPRIKRLEQRLTPALSSLHS